jgi:dolichol-phosphate mannosyltransferase
VTSAAAPGAARPAPELSLVIPALHEGENLALLLPAVHEVLDAQGIAHEILVVTNDADDATVAAAGRASATVVLQEERGYGGALIAGFARAAGRFIVTMDADLSHPAQFLEALWTHRERAEVVIASRYVPGGRAEMPLGRYVLSTILNRVFSRGLSLKVRDMSSGFRLFHAAVVRGQTFLARDFDIVQEVLVRAHAGGWRVAEVPFHYQPRRHGSSHARVFRFGLAYLRTFRTLWRLRNAIDCADYDARAFDSAIPLQRYWHGRRVRNTVAGVTRSGRVLDVGCGSSRILSRLPPDAIGLDLSAAKLRHARRYGRPLVRASAEGLPFADAAFDTVVCSQIVEHLPKGSPLVDEVTRVLAPGGRLVIGTPDSGRWQWRLIERFYRRLTPAGAGDVLAARYTRRELIAQFTARGYEVLSTRYILGAELTLVLEKGPGGSPAG